MKLHTEDQEVELSSGFKTSKFTIAASSKAFRILSSNLYSNKIRAVIRELSCNAYDAHIAAKNTDMNFDVTLPTSLLEEFKIRDYGTGLSDEDVMSLYTTYFQSTKSDSNDYVGALGLGSKSPFAYTDTFTVVSYYNGVKTSYCAFIDNGEPSISKISSNKTDEHNGIEISLPVNSNDVCTFRDEAEYVYSTFNKIPNFNGFKLNIKPVFDSLDERYTYNTISSGEMFFVMGNVRYPIERQYIPDSIKPLLNNSSLFVRVDIGYVDIAPSREALSYDDVTIENIDKIIDELKNDVVKSIRECCPTIRQKFRKLYELTGAYPHFKTYFPEYKDEYEKIYVNNVVETIYDEISYTKKDVDSYNCVSSVHARWTSKNIPILKIDRYYNLNLNDYIQLTVDHFWVNLVLIPTEYYVDSVRNKYIKYIETLYGETSGRRNDNLVIIYSPTNKRHIDIINEIKTFFDETEIFKIDYIDSDIKYHFDKIEEEKKIERESLKEARRLAKEEAKLNNLQASGLLVNNKKKYTKSVEVYNLTDNKTEVFTSFEEFYSKPRYVSRQDSHDNTLILSSGKYIAYDMRLYCSIISENFNMPVYRFPHNLVTRYNNLNSKNIPHYIEDVYDVVENLKQNYVKSFNDNPEKIDDFLKKIFLCKHNFYYSVFGRYEWSGYRSLRYRNDDCLYTQLNNLCKEIPFLSNYELNDISHRSLMDTMLIDGDDISYKFRSMMIDLFDSETMKLWKNRYEYYENLGKNLSDKLSSRYPLLRGYVMRTYDEYEMIEIIRYINFCENGLSIA